jgi:hypothetical protein
MFFIQPAVHGTSLNCPAPGDRIPAAEGYMVIDKDLQADMPSRVSG